jgi:hypothetical protein
MREELANVYDILTARIGALRSKDQGGQNVAEKKPHKGAQRRLGFFVAQNAARRFAYTVLLCAVWVALYFLFTFLFSFQHF